MKKLYLKILFVVLFVIAVTSIVAIRSREGGRAEVFDTTSESYMEMTRLQKESRAAADSIRRINEYMSRVK